MFFFWVPSAEFSIKRVENRVKLGGHYVDPDTIRRRYDRGQRNFFELYQPIAKKWFWYNNTQPPGEVLIASGHGTITDRVDDDSLWTMLRAKYDPTYRAT